MKRLFLGFSVVAVVMGFMCVAPSLAQETIKIGILGPMTGPAADIGEPMMQGAKLAIDEINAKGGIPCGATKRKLEPVVADDENTPAKSVTAAQKLINKDKITVLLGPSGSGQALAVRQVAQDTKTVMVTPAINDTIVSPDMPFIFRSACNSSDQVRGIVDLFAGKYSKFAVLHDTTGYGEGGGTEFKKALASKGLTPVVVERYEVNTLNLMPQVTHIKNSGAEFVCWFGVGADAITVGKLMKQIGLNIPVGGSNGIAMRVTLKAADKLDGWIFVDTVDGNKPEFKEFLKRYIDRYKNVPTYHPPSQASDAIYALAKGLEKTQGKGGEPLVKAMQEGISIQGASCKTGTSFHWGQGRSVAIDSTQLALWIIRNGEFEMYNQ